jgi:hypothetical protein
MRLAEEMHAKPQKRQIAIIKKRSRKEEKGN